MKGLILALTMVVMGPIVAWSQAPGSNASQVILQAEPPTPTPQVSAQTVGNRGSRQFFYWVVTRYPVGNAVTTGPAQVTNVADTLTGSNYVRVTWTGITGASSYDILRTTTPNLPQGTANIAVATGVTTLMYDNINETIGAYTVTSVGGASSFMRLDNRNYNIPVMTLGGSPIAPSFIGTTLPSLCVVGQQFFKTDAVAGNNLYLCTSANTWTITSGGGGGGTPGGSNGDVQYNNAGVFGGDGSFKRIANGRYTLYDSIGPTTLTIQAGSVQSTTALLSFLDSNGSTVLGSFARGDMVLARSLQAGYSTNSGVGIKVLDNAAGEFFNVGYGTLRRVGLASNADIEWTSGTSAYAAGDLGLARSSANNLAITNGSSTNYWLLGAGGIQCGSGDGNSAACDVGTTGARVRNVNAAGTGTFAGSVSASGNLFAGSSFAVLFGSRSQLSSPTDGNILLQNAAASGFTALQFGGTTKSFPALKRFGNAVAVRAADDTISTFATLTACSASGEGALASISDSATAVWGLVVTGGGSNHILAYCNGTDWTVAAK